MPTALRSPHTCIQTRHTDSCACVEHSYYVLYYSLPFHQALSSGIDLHLEKNIDRVAAFECCFCLQQKKYEPWILQILYILKRTR